MITDRFLSDRESLRKECAVQRNLSQTLFSLPEYVAVVIPFPRCTDATETGSILISVIPDLLKPIDERVGEEWHDLFA